MIGKLYPEIRGQLACNGTAVVVEVGVVVVVAVMATTALIDTVAVVAFMMPPSYARSKKKTGTTQSLIRLMDW